MTGARLAVTESGEAARAAPPTPPAVTLSNENGPSRSRPCRHPPPAPPAATSPPWRQRRAAARTGAGMRSAGRASPCAQGTVAAETSVGEDDGVGRHAQARQRRTPRYQVWWRLDDGSQGAKTVDTPDEARDLAAEKRLEMRRGTWRGRQRGRLPFSGWADEWWEVWSADPDRSPTTLASTESRLRLHVRPWFGDRPIEQISPADVRRWQAQLAASVGHATLMANAARWCCGSSSSPWTKAPSTANPVRKVPAAQAPRRPRAGLRRGQAPRPHPRGGRPAAGLLPAVLVGPRARPARHRPALRRAGRAAPPPGPPRPAHARARGRSTPAIRPAGSAAASSRDPRATPASARCPWPRWWSRRSAASSHPAATPTALVFTGPAAAPAARRAGVPEAPGPCCHATTSTAPTTAPWPSWPTRPAALRPTAARVLRALRDGGPQTVDQLAARTRRHGRRRSGRPPSRPPWASCRRRPGRRTPTRTSSRRWSALPDARDPCWRRSTCTAPTTSATPSRPGWRTPASPPG